MVILKFINKIVFIYIHNDYNDVYSLIYIFISFRSSGNLRKILCNNNMCWHFFHNYFLMYLKKLDFIGKGGTDYIHITTSDEDKIFY